jgi:DNA-binding GntR family transcriptional regulator
MAQIQRKKLGSQVLEVLHEMIANHRFQPGARIHVEQLTRELGVSRTPLWEAVHRLEQEGLLVHVPNRGVFMAELTPQQALDLYAVRLPLEAMAGRLAAERITPGGISDMEKALRAQRGYAAKGDLVAYSRSDFDFHGLVYEACGNPYLQETLERLKAKMRPLSHHVERILPQLLADHVAMIAALHDRDPDRAEQAFRVHNQRVMEHIQSELAAGEQPGTDARRRAIHRSSKENP